MPHNRAAFFLFELIKRTSLSTNVPAGKWCALYKSFLRVAATLPAVLNGPKQKTRAVLLCANADIAGRRYIKRGKIQLLERQPFFKESAGVFAVSRSDAKLLRFLIRIHKDLERIKLRKMPIEAIGSLNYDAAVQTDSNRLVKIKRAAVERTKPRLLSPAKRQQHLRKKAFPIKIFTCGSISFCSALLRAQEKIIRVNDGCARQRGKLRCKGAFAGGAPAVYPYDKRTAAAIAKKLFRGKGKRIFFCYEFNRRGIYII